MHTGDLGTLDAEGYGNVVGRKGQDMAIRGGENVYPVEIENVLYQHPAVADAQVFGVPDDRYGEELCAWIRLERREAAMTEEDVRSFCKDRIAYFKIPRYIRFVDEFPMTRHRQGAEIRHAATDDRRSGAEGAEDRLTAVAAERQYLRTTRVCGCRQPRASSAARQDRDLDYRWEPPPSDRSTNSVQKLRDLQRPRIFQAVRVCFANT